MTPDYQTVRTIYVNALRNGAERTSLFACEWDLAGDCDAPVYVDLYAAPDGERGRSYRHCIGVDAWGDPVYHPTKRRFHRSKFFVASRKNGNPLRVEMWTRCRKCDRCLRLKQRRWAARARAETRWNARTWFITLTVAPEHAYACGARGRQFARARATPADGPREEFAHTCRELGSELTRYIKRLRKQTRATFRYVAVFEAHKSGVPHVHMLLHQVYLGQRVNKRDIQDQWRWGFSTAKLVDGTDLRAVAYVCKYLGKDVAARVRASRHYGNVEWMMEHFQADLFDREGKKHSTSRDGYDLLLSGQGSRQQDLSIEKREVWHAIPSCLQTGSRAFKGSHAQHQNVTDDAGPAGPAASDAARHTCLDASGYAGCAEAGERQSSEASERQCEALAAADTAIEVFFQALEKYFPGSRSYNGSG